MRKPWSSRSWCKKPFLYSIRLISLALSCHNVLVYLLAIRLCIVKKKQIIHVERPCDWPNEKKIDQSFLWYRIEKTEALRHNVCLVCVVIWWLVLQDCHSRGNVNTNVVVIPNHRPFPNRSFNQRDNIDWAFSFVFQSVVIPHLSHSTKPIEWRLIVRIEKVQCASAVFDGCHLDVDPDFFVRHFLSSQPDRHPTTEVRLHFS